VTHGEKTCEEGGERVTGEAGAELLLFVTGKKLVSSLLVTADRRWWIARSANEYGR